MEGRASRDTGLVLTWHEEHVGGEFIVRPGLSLSVSLSIHRRTTKRGVTDVSWYLDRLVPTLEQLGPIVEMSWEEGR